MRQIERSCTSCWINCYHSNLVCYGSWFVIETIVMYNNSVEEAANGDVIDKQYAPIKDAKNWSIEIPENAREAVYVNLVCYGSWFVIQ